MFDRKEHFIGGNWRTATGGDLLEVISPSTEEVVGRVPVARPAEIDEAVASARRAFETGPWRRMSLAERAGCLRRLVSQLYERREQAVELQIDEMGGTRQFIEANVDGIGAVPGPDDRRRRGRALPRGPRRHRRQGRRAARAGRGHGGRDPVELPGHGRGDQAVPVAADGLPGGAQARARSRR